MTLFMVFQGSGTILGDGVKMGSKSSTIVKSQAMDDVLEILIRNGGM